MIGTHWFIEVIRLSQRSANRLDDISPIRRSAPVLQAASASAYAAVSTVATDTVHRSASA